MDDPPRVSSLPKPVLKTVLPLPPPQRVSPVDVLQLGPTVCPNLPYPLAHGFEDATRERMSQEILAP